MHRELDQVTVQCPFCFEVLEILLDPESSGEMVRDCEVCCNPWQITVRRSREGDAEVAVERLE